MGFYIHEHLSYKPMMETLTKSASRSFGRVVNIFKKLKNMGFKTYQTLYTSYVTPIMNYGSAVWGFAEYHESQVLQNRVSRYYLGVNKYTAVAATSTEMDWLDPRFQRWLEILRYKNRLAEMNVDRLPVKLYNWEKSLNLNGWVKDLSFILHYCNMPEVDDLEVKCDLEVAEARLKHINRDKWWTMCHSKRKLRTYIQIHDRSQTRNIVSKNLSRKHRSQISKFKCGSLALALETGRYSDTDIEDRICTICNVNKVETEEHFLLECDKLSTIRDHYLDMLKVDECVENNDNMEKIKFMLKPENLKTTCQMLEDMLEKRTDLLYDITNTNMPTDNTT